MPLSSWPSVSFRVADVPGQKLRCLDCLAKSEVMMSQGARAKMLTIGEIEAASVSYRVLYTVAFS